MTKKDITAMIEDMVQDIVVAAAFSDPDKIGSDDVQASNTARAFLGVALNSMRSEIVALALPRKRSHGGPYVTANGEWRMGD